MKGGSLTLTHGSSIGPNVTMNIAQHFNPQIRTEPYLMALEASKDTSWRKPLLPPSVFHFSAHKSFGVTDGSSKPLEVQLELLLDKEVLCYCFSSPLRLEKSLNRRPSA